MIEKLLREARQYVSDAGSDDDMETKANSTALLSEIDRALATVPPPEKIVSEFESIFGQLTATERRWLTHRIAGHPL